MTMIGWTFMIEQLSNDAWQIGWVEGHNDFGRVPATRAGFSTYEEAEKFALRTLRDLMRKQRYAWAKAKTAATAKP